MDSPMYGEVEERFKGLFSDAEKWDVLVQDPDEPFVDVPDPSFEELMDTLIGRLPETTVNSIRAEVWAAVELRQANDYEALEAFEREVRDDADNDRSVPDAGGADHAGAAVVDGDGGGDPGAQSEGGDAVPAGGEGSAVGAAGA